MIYLGSIAAYCMMFAEPAEDFRFPAPPEWVRITPYPILWIFPILRLDMRIFLPNMPGTR